MACFQVNVHRRNGTWLKWTQSQKEEITEEAVKLEVMEESNESHRVIDGSPSPTDLAPQQVAVAHGHRTTPNTSRRAGRAQPSVGVEWNPFRTSSLGRVICADIVAETGAARPATSKGLRIGRAAGLGAVAREGVATERLALSRVVGESLRILCHPRSRGPRARSECTPRAQYTPRGHCEVGHADAHAWIPRIPILQTPVCQPAIVGLRTPPLTPADHKALARQFQEEEKEKKSRRHSCRSRSGLPV